MAETTSSDPRDDAARRHIADAVPLLLDTMHAGGDDALQSAVAAAVEPVRLTAGETLFMAGDDADAAYFVVTGRLLVRDGDRILRRLGRGELLGEVALVERRVRTATVVADRDSVLARLPRSTFDHLVAEHPGFLRGVTRTLVRRLTDPPPDMHTVGTIAVAVTRPGLDADAVAAVLESAIAPAGSVARRSAADAPPGVDRRGLAPLLEDLEAAHRFVLLQVDADGSAWSTAALRRADRVVILSSPEPDPHEDGAIRALVELARGGIRGEVWLVPVRDADAGLPAGTEARAGAYGVDRVVHVVSGSEGDLRRLGRLASGTGVGLVLGGGGARGFAHLGVFRALAESGVPVDAVAGASIGGIMAAVIARGFTPDEAVDACSRSFRKVLDYTLPFTALVGGRRIAREAERVFAGQDVADLVLPFLCVSTDLTTSRQVVHDRGPVARAIRAGCAIPGVIPPVPFEGNLLVDGGVLDNLPVAALRATGLVGTVIAVDVAPPLGPRARHDFGLSVSGWQVLRSKLRRKRIYPSLSATLLRSMIVGSKAERDRGLAGNAADLLLEPEMRGVSMLAFDRVRPVADAGYEATRQPIAEWWSARISG